MKHIHWWRYFWDSEYAQDGTEDLCRECRFCFMTEFVGRRSPTEGKGPTEGKEAAHERSEV